MSLLFGDSFDGTNVLTHKWDGAGASWQGAGGRLGTAGVKFGAGTSGTLTKNLGRQAGTLIVGYAFKVVGSPDSQARLLHFQDNGSVQVAVRLNPDGTLSVYRGDGTTLLGSSIAAVPFNAFVFMEVKVVFSNGSGSVEIHVDEGTTLSLLLTALDTAATANAYATQVRFGPAAPFFSVPAISDFYIDDVYVCDDQGALNNDFLGDIHLSALFPNGDGAHTDGTIGGTSPAASSHESVDENPPDEEVTYVKLAAPGDTETWEYADLIPTGGDIAGVLVNTRMRKEWGGSRAYSVQSRDASLTEASGPQRGVTTDYASWQDVLEEKPSGGAWGVDDINNGEFGVAVAA